MELEIEFSTASQRLMLKEDIEKMERSALHRAQESETNIILDNVSIVSDKYSIRIST